MCTAIKVVNKNNDVIFGRTMDFSHELDPEVYVFPTNYEWVNTLKNYKIKNKYKIMGTGQNIGKITLADGMNEVGLGMAALYFQDYAKFSEPNNYNKKLLPVGSIEMVNFILGNCGNIKEVIEMLNKIDIIGIKDEVTNTVAPLHWFVVDKDNKCIVIEREAAGLKVHENDLGILTNSPNFNWHKTNLRNYVEISPVQEESRNINEIVLKQFGQGGGGFGLPGDYTSPSRFVRIFFQKNFTILSDNNIEIINTCFNIMKTVTIPKGVVVTNRETYDYTQYTVFMDITNGSYYFNTYDNNQILKASITDENPTEIISLGKLKRITEFNNM